MAVILTYFIGCIWYYIITASFNKPSFSDENNKFFTVYNLGSNSNGRNLIISCYFVMTTLATIGYGDLSPKTKVEKFTVILIMIIGIAFFSYIMGNFSGILTSYT